MILNKIYHGDCLELMPQIKDKSIDMILCDLPYGSTACSWDVIIPFEPLWKEYNRIIKDNGAVVLFGSEPFSSYLRMSNIKNYKYDWIWDKVQPTGILTVNKMPMKQHEIISIFYSKQPTYNRQMTDRKPQDIRINLIRNEANRKNKIGFEYLGGQNVAHSENYDPTKVNPKTIIRYTKQPTRKKNPHPTQKPVKLFEYLIRTYTNENEIILDNCAGSGTTGVACKNSNRNYILMEKERKYFDIAKNRIDNIQDRIF